MSEKAGMRTALAASFALAAAFEGPPTFKAEELLAPAQLAGAHHRVASAVPVDGYFEVFTVTTDWGEVEAEGRSLLLVRLDEARALAELDKVSKSQVFLSSAGGAVLNVGKSVAAVAADPAATAKGVGKGVKRFGSNLGRKAARTADKAKADLTGGEGGGGAAEGGKDAASAAGGMAASALGVSASARKWAQKVGADPYTTNPVLRKALGDIGKIDSAGSIVTKVAVPIPPVVSATANVGGLVWSKDPEALLKENEAAFTAAGATPDAIKRLYRSKGFTLTHHTRLSRALAAVRAKGLGDYVATAAEADDERSALFFVESAELLQRFHAQSPVAEVLTDSRAMIAKTKDGRAVALLPIDWVGWTAEFAKAAGEAGARAKKELAADKLELRLTGRISPVAKAEAAALGWIAVEGIK
jgi:hypothetical protein